MSKHLLYLRYHVPDIIQMTHGSFIIKYLKSLSLCPPFSPSPYLFYFVLFRWVGYKGKTTHREGAKSE